MKDSPILRTLSQRTIFVILVSMLLALQTERAFSQTTETFTTLQNQLKDAKDYDCVFRPNGILCFRQQPTRILSLSKEELL
jgi:hypothetical protein